MGARLVTRSLIALSLVAAACTGGDGDAGVTTTPADSTAPATEATAPPSSAEATTTTTSALPTTTTTTLPPGLRPQVLDSVLRSGTLASYEGTFETGIEWSVAGEGTLSGLDGAAGSVSTQWSGRRRILALEADGGTEVVEDFTAEAGRIVTSRDGERSSEDATRDQLLDFKPATPPVLIDEKGEVVEGVRSGAPAVFAGDADRLAATALVGPPLPDEQVDVGDSWTVVYETGLLGPVAVNVEIVGETEVETGVYHFVIEFGGGPVGPPASIGLEDAFALTAGLGEGQRLGDLLPPGVSGSATVTSAVLEGRVVFDPESGVASEFESDEVIAMDLQLEDAGDGATLEVEARTARSFSLDEVGPASPFERESVLDRFEVDPTDLARLVFDRLVGYDVHDATDSERGVVLNPLFDLRQDLLAGAAIASVREGDGASVLVASVTTGGEFRGAPFVGEEVAAFLSGSRPDDVGIGGETAYRVTVEEAEWLFYNNETHLLIAIGPREESRRIMADLAATFDPYLWQPGDCLDFTDGFDDATPYAPFGLHGLRHCSLEHTHEVILSEVVSEGPNARFPSDLNERSDATCGRAFYELTGTTELESALALVRYRPDEDEWRRGSRYLACVVSVGTSDSLTPVEGRIDGRDPDLVFDLEVGTCLLSLVPAECDNRHNGEIIAAFEVDAGPEAPRPDEREERDRMRAQCETAFSEFELGEGPGTVQVFEITDVFTAWEIGARDYYCMAVAFGEDGFRLDITGSFADGWEEAEERVAA